ESANEMDLNLVLADGSQWLGELDLPAVDLFGDLRLELFGDVAGGDGAEEPALLTGARRELEAGAVDLVGQRLQGFLLAENLALAHLHVVLSRLDLALGGDYRVALRDEVVAGIPIGNRLNGAGLTQLGHVLA